MTPETNQNWSPRPLRQRKRDELIASRQASAAPTVPDMDEPVGQPKVQPAAPAVADAFGDGATTPKRPNAGGTIKRGGESFYVPAAEGAQGKLTKAPTFAAAQEAVQESRTAMGLPANGQPSAPAFATFQPRDAQDAANRQRLLAMSGTVNGRTYSPETIARATPEQVAGELAGIESRARFAPSLAQVAVMDAERKAIGDISANMAGGSAAPAPAAAPGSFTPAKPITTASASIAQPQAQPIMPAAAQPAMPIGAPTSAPGFTPPAAASPAPTPSAPSFAQMQAQAVPVSPVAQSVMAAASAPPVPVPTPTNAPAAPNFYEASSDAVRSVVAAPARAVAALGRRQERVLAERKAGDAEFAAKGGMRDVRAPRFQPGELRPAQDKEMRRATRRAAGSADTDRDAGSVPMPPRAPLFGDDEPGAFPVLSGPGGTSRPRASLA